MERIFTILVLLFTISLSAQTTKTDNQIAHELEQSIFNQEFNNNAFTDPNAPSHDIAVESRSLNDGDDDGMNDDWEVSNGLDPEDPTDAWKDLDGDNILNLFEFQLNTNPGSNTASLALELSPNQANLLDAELEFAENGIKIIRLSEGDYNTNTLNVFNNEFKFMIQGGWNADFTEHNPDKYITTWIGAPGSPALNALGVGDGTDGKTAIILEGINFIGDDDFSLGGNVNIAAHAHQVSTSINNCSFSNGNFYGLQFTHRGTADSTNVFMNKTKLVNNAKGGIYTQVTEDNYCRWRFTNLTISNPGSFEGALDGLTADAGRLDIEVSNSIMQDDGFGPFNFSSFHLVDIDVLNSNVGEPSINLPDISLSNSINENPLFTDILIGDVSLLEGSPCIDTGIDLGINEFAGAAPDMGSEESGLPSSINQVSLEALNIYPNPTTGRLIISSDSDSKVASLNVLDLNGKNLFSQQFNYVQYYQEINLDFLRSGIYLLEVEHENGKSLSRIVKH